MDESVAGAVFSENREKVLLVKRRDVPVWVLPGGGIEKNESPEDAVVREIFEETGYKVVISKKIGEYIPVNKLSKFTHLYDCAILSGEANCSDETKDVRFFEVSALPKMMPPPYQEWIEDGHKNLNYVLTKKLSSINYTSLIKNFILHPILVIRFLLARLGLSINT
jgi:8-oxo-dGTP pyrophosphatase MutT (NUDIX family)